MQLKSINLTYLNKKRNFDRLVQVSRIVFVVILVLIIAIQFLNIFKKRITVSSQVQLVENQVAERLQSLQNANLTEAVKPEVKISDQRIFGELKSEAIMQPQAEEAPKVNTDFRLVGTFLDETAPIAIIMNPKSSEQDVFSVGENLFDEAKLIQINAESVEIERGGQKELLYLDEGGTATSSSTTSEAPKAGGLVKVDSKKLDEALDNLPQLLTQARAVPYFQNGQSVGLRLFAIKKGSMFDEIGLKNGDILKDINGSSLADITQAIKLFERLREEKSINLNLERGKNPVAYQYEIN